MVNQVGKPAMLEGKRFLPLTGTPMAKILRSRTLLADCEPEPLTVAIWMLKSLVTGFGEAAVAVSPCADGAPALVVAMGAEFPSDRKWKDCSLFLQVSLYRDGQPGYRAGQQVRKTFV